MFSPYRLLPAAVLLALLTSCQSPRQPAPAGGGLKSGDLVFQDSGPVSAQAAAIKALTNSQWSHCGLYFESPGGGVVVDGNGTTRAVAWAVWRSRGAGGRYAAFRLRRGLSTTEAALLRSQADRLDGRPYDVKFAWDDTKIYCSELMWKAYQRALNIQLCPLGKLSDFDLNDPLAAPLITRPDSWGTVANAQAHGNEPVVSPHQLAESGLLVPVR